VANAHPPTGVRIADEAPTDRLLADVDRGRPDGAGSQALPYRLVVVSVADGGGRKADSPFDVRCLEWLGTSDAERTAKRFIRRSGLPLDPGDLVSEAAMRILVRVDGDPGFFSGDAYRSSVPGNYCARIMRNYMVDLLRGVSRERSARRLLEADARNEDPSVTAPELTDAQRQRLAEAAADVSDGIRVAIEYSGAGPVDVSGALTVLALQRDPAADVGESPRPKAGATPDQARLWPALWFAGLREMAFPVAGKSTKAQQKYRSRAAKKLDAFLVDVLARLHRERNGGRT
jgi:hypothetical protein